jgi:paraquat-inducible protein B
VTDIKLLGHPGKRTLQIEVLFEVEPARIQVADERPAYDSKERMKELVDLGLRAQLEMQSMLTRQMMIVLDFHPDTPVKLVSLEPAYPEVPTIPSPMQELLEKVQNIPLQEITNSIRNALEGIAEVINSPDVTDSLKALKGTLEAAEKLVIHVDDQVDPLMASVDGTLGDARRLLQDVDAQVDPLGTELEETLKAARLALVKAEEAVANLEAGTREDSPLVSELTSALAELSSTSRSIRILAETLESQPESLLRGKGPSGGK